MPKQIIKKRKTAPRSKRQVDALVSQCEERGNRTIYTHDWNYIGDERIPRYPSKIGEKRPIHVDINSWIGSIGAKHWYVTVKEKNNMWWSERENAWVEISCDSEKEGYSLDKASVMTVEEAVELAIAFLKIIHPTDYKEQELTWDGEGRPEWVK